MLIGGNKVCIAFEWRHLFALGARGQRDHRVVYKHLGCIPRNAVAFEKLGKIGYITHIVKRKTYDARSIDAEARFA